MTRERTPSVPANADIFPPNLMASLLCCFARLVFISDSWGSHRTEELGAGTSAEDVAD